ncbi:hypothetical protein HBA92_17280 [Ochrobactrum sp. MR28]|nr:hypothetical protein [Ochrobactrum sp. MR28]MBX8818017.1 hypothetical protein [Ochrobactrum sp. MR31]
MSHVLTSIRDRLRDLIKAELPEFKDVDLHYGRLMPDEVRKITAFAPAARVGLFGSVKSDILPSGEIKLSPRFAAVALTKTGDLLTSTDEAMQLALDMAAVISIWRPGIPLFDKQGIETAPPLFGVGLPEAITVEPSPAPELENEGIALWGCLFTVPIVIGTSLSEQDGGRLIDISSPQYQWGNDVD